MMMNFNNRRAAGLRINGRTFHIVGGDQTTKGNFGESETMYSSKFLSTADISGQLIRDTENGNLYLANSFRYEQGIYTGLVYLAQGIVTLSRYVAGPKDSFGRPVDSQLTLVTPNIPLHFHHGSISFQQLPDRSTSVSKRTALVQTSSEIQKMDVLTTQHGTSFKVLDIETRYGLSKLFLQQLT